MSAPYFNASTGFGAPVVVQGSVVSSQNKASLLPVSTYDHQNVGTVADGQWSKGEEQPRRCRDVFWGFLFYIHLGAVLFASAKYGPIMAKDMAANYSSGAQNNNSNSNSNNGRYLFSSSSLLPSSSWRGLQDSQQQQQQASSNYGQDVSINMHDLLTVLGVAGLAALVLSSFAMTLMMSCAKPLIKMALWWNILVTGAIAILAAVSHVYDLAILTGISFLFSAYYAYVVWNRIPFAASNLVTAITAVRANLGLAFFAYTNLLVSFFWSIWWAIAFVATTYVLGECDAQGNCAKPINGILVFLFLVSFYWTAQVIKNVVHVTVAGTVGTWWFAPKEASSCCSRGVRDSYLRSITTSFGSICLGSLIVAIIQAVKEILRSMRDQEDSILLCLAECLVGCIESLAEYFNQWAFVFVGLYGYSFMEAGMNVMGLFRSRGWTTIITDMLVDTVLLMVSLGVGVLTGIVGVLAGSMANMGNATMGAAFVGGMLIGFVMCNTLFSLISSAVNAVIVCYAEAPAEFQMNHPQLSDEMRASWRQAYPVEFHY